MSTILREKQQSLSRYRQIVLIMGIVAHSYLLYSLILVAPKLVGASGFLELFHCVLSEITTRGGNIKAAATFMIILLGSSLAITVGVTLYFRSYRILATEIVRGMLILVVCYCLAYYGFILFASLSCFLWLFGLRKFYQNCGLGR